MSHRKPTTLKILQGNPSKRKLPANEPQPAIVEAIPPEGLSEMARKHWAYFAPLLMRVRVLTEADHPALAKLCEESAILELAIKEIQLKGLFSEKQLYGRDGEPKGTIPVLNPAFRIQAVASAQVNRLMVEFGLTPASRSKVATTVNPSATKLDPLAELRERAKRSR